MSIVVPVYNERDSVAALVKSVSGHMSGLGCELEFVFVADPCTDGTEDEVRRLAQHDNRIKLVELTRRFGQPTATLAGLDFANGDAVVVMDADLQDPPEVAARMVERWQHGERLVVGRRVTRSGEPAVKRATAKVGYSFLSRFSEVPIPENAGDFRLMDRSVVEQVRLFPEAHGFLRGLVALVGYEPDIVEFDRPARVHGTTKYNKWFGSLRIGFNGVVGFSTALLNISTIIGLGAATLAILTALGYVVAKIVGVEFPIGNPTIVILILLLGGCILVCLGILGMYIGRIYDEVKRRPRYLVKSTTNL